MRLTPRKKPRQARSRETMNILLDAAAKVFARHGFAHGTTNRIAARAGVSVGSVYEYFSNKESMLLALSERHVTEGEAVLRSFDPTMTVELPLEVATGLLIRGVASLHENDRALHRVLFEEAPRPPQFARRLKEAENLAVSRVADFIRLHPETKKHSPETQARMAVRLVESLIHRWAADPADQSLDALVSELTELVTGYLRAQGQYRIRP